MKVCIYGAGAIGGLIGARLSAAGQCEVSAVARGATLQALREHGWRLRSAGGDLLGAPARVAQHPADLGPQDLIVIAVKGPAVLQVASHIAPLLHEHTIVLPAVNGVPWWLAQVIEALSGQPLDSVDPGGRIAAAIPLRHVLGCVVHASASTPEPGLVQHNTGQQLIIGEPQGGRSERAQDTADLLGAAGFEVTVSDEIRQPLWYKLWGNLTMNPVSAFTGAPVGDLLDDDEVRAFCSAAMREAATVGARIGCTIEQSPEDRHKVTRKLGNFKPSMLQDVEAGRTIELDHIVSAVREIARRLQIATPNIDAILGLTRVFAQARGLYPRHDAVS